MAIQMTILVLVFSIGFALWNFLWPYLERIVKTWQAKRLKEFGPRLNEMFMEVSVSKLVFIDTVVPIIAGLMAYLLTKNWIIALVFAGLGLIAPYFVIKQMEKNRKNKFAYQLIDGLMIISSSLKAGLSLPQAFEALSEEMTPPLSQEFTLVLRQLQMGVSLDTALYNLKNRVRVPELDMAVTAIMVARETGGNLTDILTQVANTIRERNRLISRVNALCIQGKMQGTIMSILPIVFGIFVYQTDKQFFDIFFRDEVGRILLAVAVILEILGIFFIRKFSNIDV